MLTKIKYVNKNADINLSANFLVPGQVLQEVLFS
jgi:hypothetical protein